MLRLAKYLGPVMSLCLEKRGVEQSTKHLDNNRIILQFILPLSEIIIDFHDALKSISSGYASFDYEDHGYVSTHLVKVKIITLADIEDYNTSIRKQQRINASNILNYFSIMS